MKDLISLFTALLLVPLAAHCDERPIVGAIRWDGWYGDGGVVKEVEHSLGQPKYHFRLPWFAKLMGEGKVSINGDSQAIMDQEIAYAAQAGLNYWAFVDYLDEAPGLSIALNRYLAAKDKEGIRYCLVEEGDRLDKTGTKAWSRLVEHFRHPDYQTVLDGRPLLCLFGKTTKLGKAEWDDLKRQTIAAGLKAPYFVLMGWEAEKDREALGFDAVSEYACSGKGYTTDPETYERLTSHSVSEKLWGKWKSERTPCITFATAGWDTRPRQERPPSWCSWVKATPDLTPPEQQKPLIDATTATPDEIAAHISKAIEWTSTNRDLNPANVIILYAWNEHDEGGWLQPTLGADGQPDDARIKALRKVLRPSLTGTAPAKPNIVLILADDLGYGDVRCYNAESKVPTPNIDQLANEGMRFTDAHSPATVCTPSRYSLMTGQMAFRVPNGGTVFQGVGGPSLIAPGRLTLPAMLKNQGYATAAVGKWHVGLTFRDKAGAPIHSGRLEEVKRVDFSRRIEGGPLDVGFDRFFGTACCPTTDWLYAFIDGDRIPVPPTERLDKSKLPKHPYANDCRAGMIAPDFPIEEVDLVFLKKSRELIQQHMRESPGKPFFLYHATQAVHLPSFAAPEFQGKSKAGPHGDFIHEFDHIVGELMRELEKHGIAENTLVILSSDNGPETTSIVHMRADHAHDGAKPWRGVKRDNWEGGHRVPFIVRWPAKVKAGTTSDQTLCLTDIMATLASVTGAELPDDAAEDSFNMLPVLEGTTTAPIRPYLITQAFGGQRTLSIRRGPWKYIAHRGSGGNSYDKGELTRYALSEAAPEAPGQLYDLEKDPGETTNLYLKQPEVVAELKSLLEKSKGESRSTAKP